MKSPVAQQRFTVVRIAIGVVALVLIGVAGALAFREPSRPATIESQRNVATVTRNAPIEKAAEAAVTVTVPAVVTTAAPTKSDEFFRLTKTGNTADGYQAYRLAADCANTQAWQSLLKQKPTDLSSRQFHDYMAALPNVEDVCGNLSPGQIASRRQYLVKAALAGVHGAFGSLTYSEGPEGILHSFDDDDAWRTLHSAALEAGLKTADPAALIGRSQFLSNCSAEPGGLCQPTQATQAESIALLVAAWDANAIDQGKPMPPTVDPRRFTADLPLEVVEKAIADGHAMVATASKPR